MKPGMFVILLCLLVSNSIKGQNLIRLPSSSNNSTFDCGTSEPSQEDIKYLREVINRANGDALRNAGLTAIPIRVHIINQSNGTGGLSLANLNKGISYINYHYLEAGIEYYICGIDYINDDQFYDLDKSQEAALTAGNQVDNAINIYFANTLTSGESNICGYAYFPGNNNLYNTIIIKNSCAYSSDNGTFPHELGHYFSLYHTHQSTSEGNTDTFAEHVPRSGANSNCDSAGDYLCDTEADPKYDSQEFNQPNCTYTGGGMDIYGNSYIPPTNNIMSYFPDVCGGMFTPDQTTRIANGLAVRMTHTAYNIDGCQPSNVTDPSGMVATLNGGTISLQWNDNSNNETGFLLEKSTNNGPWIPILGGGLAPGITSFADTDVASNTTYQYRVKASNDNPDDYGLSNVIVTTLTYCTPTTQSGNCTASGIGVGIKSFSLTGSIADINNPNNGCTEGLSIFTNLTAIANADDVLSFSVSLMNVSTSFFPQNVSIWVDKNQDGDFSDVGEVLFQSNYTSGFPSIINGTITIPSDIAAGETRLRVRSQYYLYGVIDNPCGYLIYSETEDYSLEVPSGCDNMVTTAASSGSGSLVDVINCADAGSTVMFSSLLNGQTIDLGSENIIFDKNLVIMATPSVAINLSATTGNNTCLIIEQGISVELVGFTVETSSPSFPSIDNKGSLTLNDMTIINTSSGGHVVNTPSSDMTIKGNCMILNQ